MRVLIKEAHVEEKRGQYRTGRNVGNEYVIRKQSGWIDTGKSFPVEVTIELDRDQAAFPVGEYVITPKCFYVAKFGELKVDLKHMQPAKAAVAPARVG